MRISARGRAIQISPGWLVVAAAALVLFGGAGSRFSFGVFLRPLTEEFEWTRGSIAGALAVSGLSTALLRPIAGWLADRFDPKRVAVSGVAIGGLALLGLSRVQELWQLYALFTAMGMGFTLASPATTTKLVSTWFQRRRGLALSLATSGSAVGETVLVPLSAVALALSGWRTAYVMLALVLFGLVMPLAWRYLRARPGGVPPADELEPVQSGTATSGTPPGVCAWLPEEGLSLRQAMRTPMFWALTFGFFT